jgi:hypothetical protein
MGIGILTNLVYLHLYGQLTYPTRPAIPNAHHEGPAPLPYRGSPEDQRSSFLASPSRGENRVWILLWRSE